MGRPSGSKNRTDRPTRLSYSERRNTLTYEQKDKDYHYRVVSDVDGRIQKLESYGYEQVQEDGQLGDPTADGSTPLGSVVTRPVGGGKTGVLMKIKREYYEKDQAEKQRMEVDAKEATLYEKSKEEGHYGKLKIDRSKSA